MIENSKFNQNSKFKIQNFLPKIFITFFLIIFILQLASLLFLVLMPRSSQAADVQFKPQVIQDLGYNFNPNDKSTGNIANLVRAIYKYAIGIVGILAAVVLMIGGVIWIMAAGNATAIGEAKAWIGASLTGLVLALLSYLILATVNPALVDLKTTVITQVASIKTGCCEKPKNSNTCAVTKREDCETGWNEGNDYFCFNDHQCTKKLSDYTPNTSQSSVACQSDPYNGVCLLSCNTKIYEDVGQCSNVSGQQTQRCCKPLPITTKCEDLGSDYICVGKNSCPLANKRTDATCLQSKYGPIEECCKIKNTGTTNTIQTPPPANNSAIKGTDCVDNNKSGYYDDNGNCLTANASGGEWCGKAGNFGTCLAGSLYCTTGSRVWTGRSCVASYVCCQ